LIIGVTCKLKSCLCYKTDQQTYFDFYCSVIVFVKKFLYKADWQARLGAGIVVGVVIFFVVLFVVTLLFLCCRFCFFLLWQMALFV